MQSELRLPDPGESRELTAEGPAGRLQARLSLPAERARPEGAALICHPHPNYGGTMDNKVVYMLSRACDRAGLAALRFNFRGVGQSEGEFGGGRGETDDCLAMAALLKATLPEARIVLAGFSFGAFVSLRAAHQIKPVQLVSVAPPLDYFQGRKPPVPECPWLVVQGDADDVVDVKHNLETLRAVEPRPDIQIVEGVGHFFHGELTQLRTVVVDTLNARWQELEEK